MRKKVILFGLIGLLFVMSVLATEYVTSKRVSYWYQQGQQQTMAKGNIAISFDESGGQGYATLISDSNTVTMDIQYYAVGKHCDQYGEFEDKRSNIIESCVYDMVGTGTLNVNGNTEPGIFYTVIEPGSNVWVYYKNSDYSITGYATYNLEQNTDKIYRVSSDTMVMV
jgi:hypothetical protein